jgi:hypothetical protein
VGRAENSDPLMPAKKSMLTNAERAKRLREAAREHETDNDPASFERAFDAVTRSAGKSNREDGAPEGEAKPIRETR